MKNIKSDFPIGGMLFVSVLGIFGLGLMLYPIIVAIKKSNIIVFFNGLVLFLFGLVFFIFFAYAWIMFIRNVLIKPKEETLYLFDKDVFLDKKGRKLFFYSKDLKTNKYYNVLKTLDYIIEIKKESKEKFALKIKEKFWLNWYSPHGDFEDILLLPIVYMFFSLFFFGSVLSSLPYNLIVGVIGIYPLYLIIYDIRKKLKKKKANQELIKTIIKSEQ